MSDVDDIDVEFEERRSEGPVRVKVVPVKHVIWVASALFVLWNIVGFPLLDYYLARKFVEHNRDAEAHSAILQLAADRLSKNDTATMAKLNEVAERLSRIEGALGIGPLGNGNSRNK